MKICTVCGKKYDQGQYCPVCGGKLKEEGNVSGISGSNREYYGQAKKSSILPVVLILAAVLVLFAACLAIGLGIFFYSKKTDFGISGKTVEESVVPAGNDDLQNSDPAADGTQKSYAAAGDTEEEEPAGSVVNGNASEPVSAEFQIYADTEENYANALLPEEYLYYDSGIEDFSFYYPDNLYCSVEVEENQDCEYGHLVKKITFSGSKGSQLIYQIIRRTDSSSIDFETTYVYSKESQGLYAKEDIVLSAKDDYGRVIVTGWDSSAKDNVIYDLCKIEADYILQMKVIFPDYTGESDKIQKGYVTECFYRLCGFSGADRGPRSYEEFVKDN